MKIKFLAVTLVTAIFMVGCGRGEDANSVSAETSSLATIPPVIENTEEPVATKLPEVTIEPKVTAEPQILETAEPVETEFPIMVKTPSPAPVVAEIPDEDVGFVATSTPAPSTQEGMPWDMIYVTEETDMGEMYEYYKTFYAHEAISYDVENKPVVDIERCRAMSLEEFENVYMKYGNILDRFLINKYYIDIPSDFGQAYLESEYGILIQDNQYIYEDAQKNYAQAYWEMMYMILTEELQHIYAKKQGLSYWDAGYFSGHDGGPVAEFVPVYSCELRDDWDYLLGLCNGNEDLALILCIGASYGFSTVEEYDCFLRRIGISQMGEYEWIYMELKASGILDWDKYVVH